MIVWKAHVAIQLLCRTPLWVVRMSAPALSIVNSKIAKPDFCHIHVKGLYNQGKMVHPPEKIANTLNLCPPRGALLSIAWPTGLFGNSTLITGPYRALNRQAVSELNFGCQIVFFYNVAKCTLW
jgi:hypothetical protein